MRLILTLFLLLTALGLWEMLRHRWHRRRIPVRVHVNGSRGKSSVTRLIAAGLRAGGYRVFAKTTGSAARIILPDASERPIRRRGGPNIREQLGIFRQAVSQGADALVLECMAVRPDLQWTTEHRIVKATHGVITNVRSDHLEVMGPRLSDVARNLSSTIPKRSDFFTAEYRFIDLMERMAQDKHTRFHLARAEEVGAEDLKGFSYVELADNVSLALKVCESLKIPRETALEGMRKVTPDPGALIPLSLREGDVRIDFINLFAANDPESTAFLWKHLALGERGDRTLALVNIRADRMRRSKDLAPLFGHQIKAYRYLLIGEMTHVFADMIRRQGVPAADIIDLGGKSSEKIWARIVAESTGQTTVVGIANIGGAGVSLMTLLEGKETLPGPAGAHPRHRDRGPSHLRLREAAEPRHPALRPAHPGLLRAAGIHLRRHDPLHPRHQRDDGRRRGHRGDDIHRLHHSRVDRILDVPSGHPGDPGHHDHGGLHRTRGPRRGLRREAH